MPDDLTWPSGGHYFHHIAGIEWDDGELIEEDTNKDGSQMIRLQMRLPDRPSAPVCGAPSRLSDILL